MLNVTSGGHFKNLLAHFKQDEERTLKTGLAEQIEDQRQPLRGEAT